MTPTRSSSALISRLQVLAAMLVFAAASAHGTDKILHTFVYGGDGEGPHGRLVFDSAGNAYGTTAGGGTHASGTVFRLTPATGGGWTESLLHTFTGGADGANPFGGVVFDSAGNLYGTTETGGNLSDCNGAGCGTVFQLVLTTGGWRERTIYSFTGYQNNDGQSPYAGLILDSTGNLYGTTEGGGAPYDAGTVFELSHSSHGWTETVLHVFNPNGSGSFPIGGLVFDTAGNLYGTVSENGTNGDGAVFELVRASRGWNYSVLYGFTGGSDGSLPDSELTIDAAGNLYGATYRGGNLTVCLGGAGTAGCGVIFELSQLSGSWHESVIYAFGGGSDGATPESGLSFDSAGNLYGTTISGGGPCATEASLGCGTAFELTHSSTGWTETLLHSFTGGSDGSVPGADLVFDSAGNLYGMASGGGAHGVGAVFTLTPSSGGGWTESVAHSFSRGGDGLGDPSGSLISDIAGNLYGTTSSGGANAFGSVFELSPVSGGGWSELVLYSFVGGKDGVAPSAALTFDSAGNLYGTTFLGGARNAGTVFQLSPNSNGTWKEKVLHSFASSPTDGLQAFSTLVFDAAGNLHGTTEVGGVHGSGTVFELGPNAGGGWSETPISLGSGTGAEPYGRLIVDSNGNDYGTTSTGGFYASGTVFEVTPSSSPRVHVLYSFMGGSDGAQPYAGLISDSAGNFYGTTAFGGSGTCNLNNQHGCGTVFMLTPGSGGTWTETVLYSFGGTDGAHPYCELVFDAAGNLYGTTSQGGAQGFGTVFKLTPVSGGGWSESILHSFANGTDGRNPHAGVLLDANGNLYGTAESGGIDSLGVVFEVTP